MTTSKFANLVTPRQPAHNISALLGVINEFVAALNENGEVGAALRGGSTLYLKVYPLHRPNRGADILSFYVKPTGVQVRVEPLRIDSTPETLRETLVNFAKTDAFQETLQNLRDMAKWPVEAILDGQSRVYVEVTAADQEKLGNAKEGTQLELTVKRIALTGNGKMPENPEKLFSAGLVATVTNAESVNGDSDVLKLTVKKEKDAD